MRIDFDVARIEDDAGTRDAIVERSSAVALVQIRPREHPEPRVLERSTGEHAQRPDDPALDRKSRRPIRAADAIEVGATGTICAVAIVDRVVALPEVAEAIGA